jgi:hypothetical protein
MDLIDLQLAECEADINFLASDDWEVANEFREERYLYQILQSILLGRISELPEYQEQL